MCSTPYCFGDCDECEAENAKRKEDEASNARCPYKSSCKLVTRDVKTDVCTSCGKKFNY